MRAAPQQVRFRDYFSPVASWRAQPRWAKLLFLFAGSPALLLLIANAMLASDSSTPAWFYPAFGVALAVVAVMQVNFVRVLFRGHW